MRISKWQVWAGLVFALVACSLGNCGGRTVGVASTDSLDASRSDLSDGSSEVRQPDAPAETRELCLGECAGRECGIDDCGNFCGNCPDGTICLSGECQSLCTGDVCMPHLGWVEGIAGERYDIPMSLVRASNGDLVVAGYFSSPTLFLGDLSTSSARHDCKGPDCVDAFLARLSPQGTVLSLETFGGPDYEAVTRLAVTSDGDAVALGLFRGTASGWGVEPLTSMGQDSDVFVCRLSGDDEAKWCLALGSQGNDLGWDVVVDDDDNAYVVGKFEGPVLEFAGQQQAVADVDCHSPFDLCGDIFVVKISPQGELLWSRFFGGTQEDMGTRLARASDGHFYMIGDFSSPQFSLGGETFHMADVACTEFGACNDGFIAKFSDEGDHVWSKHLDGDNQPLLLDLVVDESGDLVVAGVFTGEDLDVGSGILPSAGYSADIFLAKLAPDGTAIWAASFGTFDQERVYQVDTDGDGNIIVAGATKSALLQLGEVVVKKSGPEVERQAFLAQFDPAGDCKWAKGYGGGGDVIVDGLVAGDFGEVYVAGTFETALAEFAGDFLENQSADCLPWEICPSDGFVLRIDQQNLD